MKSLLVYKLTFILSFILALGNTSFSSNIYTKTVSKTFDTKKGNILKIDNKYGNINILNWDKNEISIQLIINIEDVNESRANKLHANISKSITKINGTIKAQAKLNSLFKTTNDFNINYEIRMPSYIQVQLNNEFGNISIDSINAITNINLHYGNLTANFISKSQNTIGNINLKYAKANINTCQRSKINLSFSELTIQNSLDLYITSKSSKIEVLNSKYILAESKYDFYNIGNIDNLSVSSSEKSRFKISYLKNKIDINQTYGKLYIDKLSRFFSIANLNLEHVNSSISIEDRSEYTLNMNNSSSTIYYPEMNIFRSREKNRNLKVIIGEQNNNTNSTVNINSKHSTINIK